MSQDLNSAMRSASDYMLSGLGLGAAAAEAGAEFDLNPKLVMNRLLARHSATAETLMDKLLAAQSALGLASVQAEREALSLAVKTANQVAENYTPPSEGLRRIGKIFEFKGEKYAFSVYVAGRPVYGALDTVLMKRGLRMRFTDPNTGRSALVRGIGRFNKITEEFHDRDFVVVVGRKQEAKPCVVGCEELDVSALAGLQVTICGSTGRVWVDVAVPVLGGTMTPETIAALEWVAELRGQMVVLSDLREGVPGVPFILSSIYHWGDDTWLSEQIGVLAKSTVPPGSFFRLQSPSEMMNGDDLIVSRMAGSEAMSGVLPWASPLFKKLGLPVQTSNPLASMQLHDAGVKMIDCPVTVAGLMKGGVVALSGPLELAFGGDEAKNKILSWCRSEFGTVVVGDSQLPGVVLFQEPTPQTRAA